MSRISSFITRMGEDATLSTRTVSVLPADRDAVTKWPKVTWAESDVKMFVDEVQTREVDSMAGGRITEKRMKGFVGCSATISHMDQITYHGEVFEVESTETPEYLYGNLQYQRVILVRISE